MRHDDALINDMLLASQRIMRFINGLDFDQFQQNELVQGAVIKEVLVIGEAARNVSESLKKQYSVIEWKDIIGMRNILIHEYFNVRYDILWRTIQIDVKFLIPQLEKILTDLNRPISQ